MRRNCEAILMRSLLTIVLGLGLVSSMTGCSRAPEFCDLADQCERFSDNQYDECIIAYEEWEDRAEIYGCSDQFYALHDCAMDNHVCVNGEFSPELTCLTDELVKEDECERDGSRIR